MLEHQNKGWEPGISKKIIHMAINGIGIRDTTRILDISKGTVMDTLKKQSVMRLNGMNSGRMGGKKQQ